MQVGPNIELLNMDCMEYMRTMPDNSVDAIVTDPPYFGVKDDDWDNQWKDADAFITWIGELSEQWQRILRPNGSLYCFASPRMAARVEVKISERFDVLQNIVWNKPTPGRGAMTEKDALRNYFPASERIVFAHHYGSDDIAMEGAGYKTRCDEAARDTFGKYITAARKAHGLTMKDLTAAVGAHGAVNHGGACSNWECGYNVPTLSHYNTIQSKFPGCFDREYEDLRREYEELRTQYEELRRPFNVTADVPYTDVWTFKTVQAYEGKHVCEKPIALMEHMVLASTKPGAVVFDPFTGSGSTGVACVLNGRSFIGCEKDPHWHKYATRRIEKAARQPRLFDAPKPTATQLEIDRA